MKNPDTQIQSELTYSLRHLQAELARIDLLIQREVIRWQRAGQDPSDTFRGLYVSDAEATALLARPFSTEWGQMLSLEPEEKQALETALAQTTGRLQSFVDGVRKRGVLPRLLHLVEAFGLERFDLDTLLICLAPALDLRYERIYGYLQDDVTRKRPSVNLVLTLLCEPGPKRLLKLPRFNDKNPLFRYRLLERSPEAVAEQSPLLSQALSLDQAVVSWLLGKYRPHADLGPHAALWLPQENEADRLLVAKIYDELQRVFQGQPVIVFVGPDNLRQQAAARTMALQAKRPLLTVNLEAVTQTGVAPMDALELALRDARLTNAIPCLLGWDAYLTDGAPPPDLLARVCAYPDWVIVVGEKTWRAAGIDRDRPLFGLDFPVPTYDQRCVLWQHFMGQEAPDVDLDPLAGQFALTSGQIRDAVASARDIAKQSERPLQNEHLFTAARVHSNPRLASLARKIEPRYDWTDIVLPDDQLALLGEIVDTVRKRPQVLYEWGIGKKLASSDGVTVLFAGPPGTGKTMAAEVIADELGLDLYKIDLSTVVSKYIGETEKNLEKIFNEAQSSNAILFFDEADAIFGKRSEVKDAHDRYANIEISYLLQRMEAYDGVTILATNLRANLDEAFTRRLQFAVDFPFPDQKYRERIWHALFPDSVPRDSEIDFGLLAERFRLAGGNIRNIIVSAAYLAAADGGLLTMDHLFHGTRREMQKMGRLVREKDLELESSGPSFDLENGLMNHGRPEPTPGERLSS